MAAGGSRPGNYCYRDVVPFTALVIIECIAVGGSTMYKAATSQGMSNYVFIVYTFLIGSLLLLPYPFFICRRRSVLPQLRFSVVFKIFVLGIMGYLAQVFGYIGLDYGTPTLSTVIGNLTPAFTFILAIIFRMEKLKLKSFSTQAKITGTMVSISGAFIATLYKGQKIGWNTTAPPSPALDHSLLQLTQSNWVVGGLLLAGQNLMLSIIYVFQAQIMKEYPVDLIVVLIYDISGLIVSAIAGFFIERDLAAWKIKPGIVLATIIYMGFFSGFLTGIVHTWALRLKGPLYLAMFKPLSIVVAIVMGVLLLGETLYLGSIIGATVISVGFYAVLWGKAKEEEINGGGDSSSDDSLESSTQKLPLLQSHGRSINV